MISGYDCTAYNLLKLNRSRRLTSQIIEYPVDSLNLIYDSRHYGLQHLKRNICAFCGHEINSLHGTKRNGIIVRSLIAHNADTAHVCEGGKILVDVAVETSFCNFFTVNRICILHDADFFSGYLADDTNSKSRTREWLTEYEVFRNAEFETDFADLIFEKVTERLDDFFEINVIRETADVVVALDDSGFTA